MKRYQLLLSLLLLSQLVFTQDIEISDKDRERYEQKCTGNEDCIRAHIVQYSGRGYEAIERYWPIIELAEETKNWQLYLACVPNVVFMYGGRDDYQVGLDLAEEALNKIKTEAPQYLKDCYWIYNSLIGIYYRLLDEEKVHEVNLLAMKLLEDHYPEGHHLFVRGYNNLGASYSSIGKMDRVLVCYLKAEKIYENLVDPEPYEGAYTYENLSSYYFEIGNFELAVEYMEKAIAAASKRFSADEYHFLYKYLRLGHIYEVQKEYIQAFEFYEKAYYLDQQRPNAGDEYRFKITLDIHFYLASVCLKTNRFEEAAKYYQQILDLLSDRKERWIEQIDAKLGIADVEYRRGDLNEALSTYQRTDSLLTAKLNSGSYGEDVSRINTLSDNIHLGYRNIYQQKGEYDLAIYHSKQLLENKKWDRIAWDHAKILASMAELYQSKEKIDSALYYNGLAVSTLSGLNTSKTFVLPHAGNILNIPVAYEVLHQRAQLLMVSDFASGEKTAQALQVIDLLDELHARNIKKINILRGGQSKSLVDQATAPYQLGIDIAYEHYQTSQASEALDKAFYYTQKMKAQQLWLSLLKEEAKQYSQLETSLLEAERDLQAEITFYEKKLIEAQQDKDSTKINHYKNDILFKLNNDYVKLQRKLERDYPDYYASKYEFVPETAASLQEVLEEQEMLIEYVFTDSLLYIFTLSSNGHLQLTQTDLQETTAQQIDDINHSLQRSAMLRRSSREKFIALSHDLYQQFLYPIADQLKGKQRLIIIGDGMTNYIPFETLLASNEVKPFPDLHFLIKDFEVSYHYSAGLFAKARRKRPSDLNGLFAFAPIYDYSGSEIASALRSSGLTFRAIREDGTFLPLPESEKEVEDIAALFNQYQPNGANIALRKSASESMLKKELSKSYQFVHIAGHSFADLDNPKFSGIACFQNNSVQQDTIEDGILYTGEIYNINTSADLVTLSSCESGFGKLEKTEGLLGLNRAFIYAGAQNVVYSLWKVYDKVSAQLMVNFYKGILEKGQSYSASLRSAKLEQLNNPATASPHYWGAYLLIGQ